MTAVGYLIVVIVAYLVWVAWREGAVKQSVSLAEQELALLAHTGSSAVQYGLDDTRIAAAYLRDQASRLGHLYRKSGPVLQPAAATPASISGEAPAPAPSGHPAEENQPGAY